MFTGRLFGKMSVAQVKRAGEAMAKAKDAVAAELKDRVAARKEPISDPHLDSILARIIEREIIDGEGRPYSKIRAAYAALENGTDPFDPYKIKEAKRLPIPTLWREELPSSKMKKYFLIKIPLPKPDLTETGRPGSDDHLK